MNMILETVTKAAVLFGLTILCFIVGDIEGWSFEREMLVLILWLEIDSRKVVE